jgi:hypothetical protein
MLMTLPAFEQAKADSIHEQQYIYTLQTGERGCVREHMQAAHQFLYSDRVVIVNSAPDRIV